MSAKSIGRWETFSATIAPRIGDSKSSNGLEQRESLSSVPPNGQVFSGAQAAPEKVGHPRLPHSLVRCAFVVECSLAILCALACIGCREGAVNKEDLNMFVFELRIIRSLNPDPKTTVALIAAHGEDATRLMDCKQSDAEGFLIFRREFLLHRESRTERGLVVAPYYTGGGTNNTAQVFRLSNLVIAPTDWSKWQKPDYIENGNAAWTFLLEDRKVPGRSTNLPGKCFELHYGIERSRKSSEKAETRRIVESIKPLRSD